MKIQGLRIKGMKYVPRVKTNCLTCGLEINVTENDINKYNRGKYCSYSCYHRSTEKSKRITGVNNPTKKEEVRKKISESRMGISSWNKGLTKETDSRLNYDRSGNPFKPGSGHIGWKGGITPLTILRIHSKEWTKVKRPKILRRDDYKCQICGELGNDVHHVIPFNSSDGYDLDFLLVTLCKKHHAQKERQWDNRKYNELALVASNVKLLNHLDRLLLIQKEGIFKPITVEIAPTNKCNLNCVMCSVKNRDQSQFVPLEDLKIAIDDLSRLGLKSVELTGGGDATLYPYVNELIQYIYDKGIAIGMITNGILLKDKIAEENLDKLNWLRISMNCLDYVDDIDIPQIKGTLGASYIWNDLSTKKQLERIAKYVKRYNFSYCRIAPDCLSAEKIEEANKYVPKLVSDYDSFFYHAKTYKKPMMCWWGYLKPFLNADGYIYRCSANPLIERKFHSDFRMGHISKISEIWESPKTFYTDKCGLCLFGSQNELIQQILTKVPHEDFI